ncbi:Sigma non-opioid intracellular receptor 1 [Trichoplax sp. H2]|uniref:Sigma non-opioid intracellular receptor 1 n=1 Tax=Trichoplax adhaerens TaxID=10228 RepID=B3S1H2_TRIAD|nr:hypothetical protein TRIADDRAFT_28090 [Trichoplax adhaerens]EDV23543.1 hypothetical protein TRIADDRAFT_28090 [Trichoplax adhaerens]RDD44785.1 Sigma non-opioid intracellular receptor 1 [Trichoplax sp. H2]|eukprot:XP_002114453.1 hypothetical protein TRIADDRAFT_28090 [Trichoplax adhaerens]
MAGLIKGSLLVVISIAAIAIITQRWLDNKSYLFSHDEIAEVAKKAVGMPIDDALANVTAELKIRYPRHILEESEWIFINCGGWMGSFYLLHASITEYVLVFGTAIDTSGHSGRYWATISDTILSGSFRQWKEGTTFSNVHRPGTTVIHEIGEVTAVQWSPNTWMVEYGRGFIPSTLGFALSDTIFGTQDFVLLFRILRIYARAITQELLQGVF